jgi:hypothetical protein
MRSWKRKKLELSKIKRICNLPIFPSENAYFSSFLYLFLKIISQITNISQLKKWREKFVRKKRRIRSFSSYFYVRFVSNFVWKEQKRAKNKQTSHGNWCVFCNNVLKFYTQTMNSLGENEFCETNVKEGAKRTNDSLSFLFGLFS